MCGELKLSWGAARKESRQWLIRSRSHLSNSAPTFHTSWSLFTLGSKGKHFMSYAETMHHKETPLIHLNVYSDLHPLITLYSYYLTFHCVLALQTREKWVDKQHRLCNQTCTRCRSALLALCCFTPLLLCCCPRHWLKIYSSFTKTDNYIFNRVTIITNTVLHKTNVQENIALRVKSCTWNLNTVGELLMTHQGSTANYGG